MYYHNYKNNNNNYYYLKIIIYIFGHKIQTMVTYHNRHGDVEIKCIRVWNTSDGTSK